MPFDETNNYGGGGGGPNHPSTDLEAAMATILAYCWMARPNFEPTGEPQTEQIDLTIMARVRPDGSFIPFLLGMREWCQMEYEDPEDDPGKAKDGL